MGPTLSLLTALGLTPPAATPAAEPSVELGRTQQPILDAIELEAGSSCLQRSRLAGKVVTYLGRSEVDVRITVLILGDADDPTRVRFAVRKQGELAAERTFAFEPTASCEEKHAVVSVAVALAIDATLVEEEEPGDPIVEPVPVAPRDPQRRSKPPAEDTREQPEPVQPSNWAFRLGLGAGVSIASPPPVGGYGSVFAEFGWKDYVDLSIGAVFSGSGPQDAGVGRALLSAAGGHGQVCGGNRFGRVGVRGCAGLILGAAFATGQGFAEDRTSRVPWLAVTAGGDLRIRVASSLDLEVGGDLVVNAVRPAFDYLDGSRARTRGLEYPVLGGFAGLGVIFSLR